MFYMLVHARLAGSYNYGMCQGVSCIKVTLALLRVLDYRSGERIKFSYFVGVNARTVQLLACGTGPFPKQRSAPCIFRSRNGVVVLEDGLSGTSLDELLMFTLAGVCLARVDVMFAVVKRPCVQGITRAI